MNSHGVKLDTTLLVALPAKFNAAVERACEKTGDQTIEIAQQLAHVVTGAMQAGMYKVTSKGSGYDAAVDAALAQDLGTEILPEVGAVQPGEVVVSNVTAQSVFEEYGTVLHGPHPFMGPAALSAEPLFVSNLEKEVGDELK